MPPETALPVLRAAFEATGSGAWVMGTVIDHGLDRAAGFRLDLALGDDRVQGRLQATEARLAAGEAEVIDTDWLSLARCRPQGLAIAAVAPYGAIFGGLVAPRAGLVRTLADLPGRRLGMVRTDDKNWLLLRAACRRQPGFDPGEVCRPVVAGSKTRLRQLLADGEVDAALAYWHQVPALTAGGFTEVCDLLDLLPVLGARAIPSTFFAAGDSLIAGQPGLVAAFRRAVAAAIAMLRNDATAWRQAAMAPPAIADALRAKWLARIGLPWDPAMAGELSRLAAQLGDPTLPPGIFAGELFQGEQK